MTGEDKARRERLERAWAKVPKATVERLWAAAARSHDRLAEIGPLMLRLIKEQGGLSKEAPHIVRDIQAGLTSEDRHIREYAEAKSKLSFAQIIESSRASLRTSKHPDAGRPAVWGEDEYGRMDAFVDRRFGPTTAARKVALEDGCRLTGQELKDFVDARVKAWRKSSSDRERRNRR
jgi:hypothetical protein